MHGYDAIRLVAMFRTIANVLEEQAPRVGDAAAAGGIDPGLKRGFGAVVDALDNAVPLPADPTGVLKIAAKSLEAGDGDPAGRLYGKAFNHGAKACEGKSALDEAEVAAMFGAMVDALADGVKDKPGQEGMLDAWVPAYKALKQAAGDGKPLAAGLSAAVRAAADGARTDPAAASAAIIIDAIRQSLGEETAPDTDFVRGAAGPA